MNLQELSSAIHCLVVDDDNRIRQLLERYLQNQGFVVSTASRAAQARELMAGFSYDIVVLDIMMPEEDGLSVLQWVKSKYEIPVIMLTAKSESSDRIAGLAAGADDYLSKPFEPQELALRIRNICRRKADSPDQIMQLGDISIDLQSGFVHHNGELIAFSEKEREVLVTLAKANGEVVHREQLLDKECSERAVDILVTRIRKKLKDSGFDPHVLMTARGKGYKLNVGLANASRKMTP